MTGNQTIGGDAAVTFAGYGSAGEQPERLTLPKGLLPPGRVWAQCLHAVRIRQASSPLAACVKLRGFGGRATKTADEKHRAAQI